jgi:hypothetical protein
LTKLIGQLSIVDADTFAAIRTSEDKLGNRQCYDDPFFMRKIPKEAVPEAIPLYDFPTDATVSINWTHGSMVLQKS